MAKILIMIGSTSDECFLKEGLAYLQSQKIDHEVVVSSTHREPKVTSEKIVQQLKDEDLKVIIGGAATATGLPGVIAGYLRDTLIPVFGVRFTKNPGQSIIEDATFSLSSMPSNVPLAYTGFNEKGFLHACMLSARIVRIVS